MQDAPANTIGLTKISWWQDQGRNLWQTLVDAGLNPESHDLSALSDPVSSAELVGYIGPSGPVTVLVRTTGVAPDSCRQEYFYFVGLPLAEAIGKDWIALGRECQKLTATV